MYHTVRYIYNKDDFNIINLEMRIMSARERDRAHMSALTDFFFMSALT